MIVWLVWVLESYISRVFLVKEESYLLHVRSQTTDDSYNTMLKSNGYYRGRSPKKNSLFYSRIYINLVKVEL
jgi:hypothetical protein